MREFSDVSGLWCQGVGLKMKVADVKHMVFGECHLDPQNNTSIHWGVKMEFVSFPNNYLRWEWLQIPGQRAWGKSAGEAKASKGTGTSVFFVRCACTIAFAWPCRMPGIWCISWSIAVRAARGCMGQRSTSSSRRWCSEEETWSRWSWWFWAWTQLRCRSDHLVILCHFVYRYLPRTWKVSTGLSSDNFSSNTSHLSTAVIIPKVRTKKRLVPIGGNDVQQLVARFVAFV